MAVRICLWCTMMAFTAIVPGGVAGILAHARRWPRERCRETARRGGWAVVAGSGLVAWLLGSHHPYGWVTAPAGSTAGIVAAVIWMAVAEYVPRRIAQRIAFGN